MTEMSQTCAIYQILLPAGRQSVYVFRCVCSIEICVCGVEICVCGIEKCVCHIEICRYVWESQKEIRHA